MSETLILVIEDDPLNLEIISRLLKAQGYQLVTAGDAEEGLALARERRPDLVLMDIGLNGDKDGVWASKQIKSDSTIRHIPVIACTAHAMQADMQRAQDNGCDDFIIKPYEFSTALETVRRHLRKGAPA